MTAFSVDASELHQVAADMRAVDSRLVHHVARVVERGALNIRNDLREQMRKSTHFAGVAGGITYDDVRDVGSALETEIGPERGRPGGLANIAYFGAGRGVYRTGRRFSQVAFYGAPKGGGTVEDPQGALDRETPALERHLGDLLEDLAW